MRYLLVGLLLVCSNVFAQSAPITVVGEGADAKQAKNNAFQKAIEQEVGLALLSHREVKNSKLFTDSIITHSAGYVDDFKIIKTEVENGVHYVTVKVWVKSSVIHERILGAISDAKFANGEKISQQYESYNNAKKTGDEVLKAVLADYPKSAFVIKVVKHGADDMVTGVDQNRNPMFIIKYKVTYNYNFFKSLNEALKLTSDKKISNRDQHIIAVKSKKPGAFFIDTDVYYINDNDRADLIKQGFIGFVHVKFNALDSSNNSLFHGCNPLLVVGDAILLNKEYVIQGTGSEESEVVITRKQGDPLIEKINSFSLTIQPGPCYN